MKDFTDDLERTANRTRDITVNGTTYTVRCSDPYGLWTVESCPHPDLDGTWTSLDKIERVITAYENKKEAKAVSELPENKSKKTKNTASLL